MTKTIVKIDGMMCANCESHVNEAIKKNFTVKSVKADRTKNQAEIISDAALDENKVKEVIAATGYDFGGMTAEPYKRGLFRR